jgi:hypothetical protein
MLTVDWFPHNLLIAQLCLVLATLICAIKVVGIAVESKDSRPSKFFFALVICAILFCIASMALLVIQSHKSPHSEGLGSFTVSRLHALLSVMGNPWPQRLLFFVMGAGSMTGGTSLLRAISSSAKKSGHSQKGEKGYLDYKLQAEDAMAALPAALEPISQVMARVGTLMESETSRVQAASNSSTLAQTKVISRSARRLDRLSRMMDEKCEPLEKIGDSIVEGQLGWFTWMKSQSNRKAAQATVVPLMTQLTATLRTTDDQTGRYVETIRAMRGVSKDLNLAVDAHLKSVERVRNVNIKILNSCINTLHLLEDAEG